MFARSQLLNYSNFYVISIKSDPDNWNAERTQTFQTVCKFRCASVDRFSYIVMRNWWPRFGFSACQKQADPTLLIVSKWLQDDARNKLTFSGIFLKPINYIQIQDEIQFRVSSLAEKQSDLL
jgi:hypothetical protein